MDNLLKEKIYNSIKTEFDLVYLIRKIPREGFDWALCQVGNLIPWVTAIPKGKKIKPDLDLICIQKYSNREVITGWEVKLVRPNDPFKYFYQGLGEILFYPYFGVDKPCLLLGWFNFEDEKAEERLRKKLKEKCEFLKTHKIIPSYIQVEMISNLSTPPSLLLQSEGAISFDIQK